ncbi:MAG: aspartate 1-decarboxylase [Candidatus Omnitrophica bacterium]|nr:aspartate 1-decarboxylase [Candidatus Omnitrophota bacterium]
MFRTVLKSKIHHARVTQTNLDYEGSITIDEALMKKADLLAGEKVEIFNMNNGARFETYCIKGEKNSGIICLNGPAAHLAKVGDIIIIVSYFIVKDKEAHLVKPKIIHLDERNHIKD